MITNMNNKQMQKVNGSKIKGWLCAGPFLFMFERIENVLEQYTGDNIDGYYGKEKNYGEKRTVCNGY